MSVAVRGRRSALEAKRRKLEGAAGSDELSPRFIDAMRDCVDRTSRLLRVMDAALHEASTASIAQQRSVIEGFRHSDVVEALEEVTGMADSLVGKMQDVCDLHCAVAEMAAGCGGEEVRLSYMPLGPRS